MAALILETQSVFVGCRAFWSTGRGWPLVFAPGHGKAAALGLFCVYALYSHLDRVLFDGLAADWNKKADSCSYG